MDDTISSRKEGTQEQEPTTGQEEEKLTEPKEKVRYAPTTALVWREFLLSRAVQDMIGGVNRLIEINIQTKAKTTRWASCSLLLLTFVLALIVIVPASILAWYSKISSDAATFLFGAVVGAAFTFLRGFISPNSG